MTDIDKSELVKQINEIKDRLAGRNRTHQEVAKRSGWSRIELENVIKEDGWIYEDEMLALITQQQQPLKVEIAFWKTIVSEKCGFEYYKATDEAYEFERKAQAKETEEA